MGSVLAYTIPPTDAAHFGVSGIAEELTQVAPMPDANTMDRIIKALS